MSRYLILALLIGVTPKINAGEASPVLVLDIVEFMIPEIKIEEPSEVHFASFGVMSNLLGPYKISVASVLGNGKLLKNGERGNTGIDYTIRFGEKGQNIQVAEDYTVVYEAEGLNHFENSISGEDPKLELYISHESGSPGYYLDEVVFTIEQTDGL